MDFERRFGGIARIFGAKTLERFSQTHLAVIGVGGVGSWTVEAFARSAIGKLTLIDLDHVAESNINRQLHALDNALGRPKITVLAERIQQINPTCQIELIEDFVVQDNVAELIKPDFAWVIDCIDNFRVKAAIIAHCKRQGQKVLTVGGAGGQIDAGKIQVADLSRTEHDPLLSRTRKILRQDYAFARNPKRRFEVPAVYSSEQQKAADTVACVTDQVDQSLNCAGFGSLVTVTAVFGLVAAGEVLNRIAAAEKKEQADDS